MRSKSSLAFLLSSSLRVSSSSLACCSTRSKRFSPPTMTLLSSEANFCLKRFSSSLIQLICRVSYFSLDMLQYYFYKFLRRGGWLFFCIFSNSSQRMFTSSRSLSLKKIYVACKYFFESLNRFSFLLLKDCTASQNIV